MVGKTINVRFDSELTTALTRYMTDHGMTQSQAVRSLCALHLTKLYENANYDAAFYRRAFEEGIIDAQRQVKEKFAAALRSTLDGFGEKRG